MNSFRPSEKRSLVFTLVATLAGFAYFALTGYSIAGALFVLIMLAMQPISIYLRRREAKKETQFTQILASVDLTKVKRYQALTGFLTFSSSILTISLFALRAFGFLESFERILGPFLLGFTILLAVLWRGVGIWKWRIARGDSQSREGRETYPN